jgi:hypothetical protein
MRDKSRVVVQRQIAFSAEPIKDRKQAGVFLVDMGTNKFDYGDVMSGLAANAGGMAKHESQRSLEHGFVCLLKTCFFIKSENLASGNKFLLSALKKALDLGPVYAMRL